VLRLLPSGGASDPPEVNRLQEQFSALQARLVREARQRVEADQAREKMGHELEAAKALEQKLRRAGGMYNQMAQQRQEEAAALAVELQAARDSLKAAAAPGGGQPAHGTHGSASEASTGQLASLQVELVRLKEKNSKVSQAFMKANEERKRLLTENTQLQFERSSRARLQPPPQQEAASPAAFATAPSSTSAAAPAAFSFSSAAASSSSSAFSFSAAPAAALPSSAFTFGAAVSPPTAYSFGAAAPAGLAGRAPAAAAPPAPSATPFAAAVAAFGSGSVLSGLGASDAQKLGMHASSPTAEDEDDDEIPEPSHEALRDLTEG